MNLSHHILMGIIISFFVSNTMVQASNVGKWRRYVVLLENDTYDGNPFELEVDGIFTHAASGTSITLPGYYAGKNKWKIGFMPNRIGEWTFVTCSSDPNLNRVMGPINCVESGLPGMLTADPNNPKKWKFTDGNHVVPMAFRMEFFFEPASTLEFTAAADFLKNGVKGHMFETRLTDENGWYGGRNDYIFSGSWINHTFDIAIWDRMEERMEILTERGLGAHVMFYSDDAGKHGRGGRSITEALVIRYVIARLAGYPIVLFNTGIDISEYRLGAGIDWFGAQIESLDPYNHSRSSRHGGGSGRIIMDNQNFNSDGERTASIYNIKQAFDDYNFPANCDDAWGENYGSHSSKDHTPADIRRAFWKCTIVGGNGGLVRGGGNGLPDDGYFSIKQFGVDLESEQWLKLINPFIEEKLGDTFGVMAFNKSLVCGTKCYCLTDQSKTKILYFLIGENDTYDPGGGGNITVKLSGLSGTYNAIWFNPRTGAESNVELGILAGGSNYVISPPDKDDWVLLLTLQITTSSPSSNASNG